MFLGELEKEEKEKKNRNANFSRRARSSSPLSPRSLLHNDDLYTDPS